MTNSSLLPIALVALAGLTPPAPALPQQNPHAGHGGQGSPYAEQEATDIAALSRRELDDLLAGAGMGLARPAELNQYPGPKHVLELAGALALTGEQRDAVERVRLGMLEEAQRLGREIVEAERRLDRRFAHRHIDEDTLRATTTEVARLYGELRFVHLRAHLETRDILSAEQIESYDHLRGYSSPSAVATGLEVETQESSLERAERAFARAASERDRDGFRSYLTPETVFATPHGNLRGPDAILEQWAGFFAPGGPSIGWDPDRVAVVGDGTVGLTSGPFWIEAPDAEGGTTRFTGRFFSVWRPDANGEWRIVLDTGTDAEPEG